MSGTFLDLFCWPHKSAIVSSVLGNPATERGAIGDLGILKSKAHAAHETKRNDPFDFPPSLTPPNPTIHQHMSPWFSRERGGAAGVRVRRAARDIRELVWFSNWFAACFELISAD